jgi:translation initiation factor 2B subunit (eIF-2B alpha/beta/delta family)
MRRFLDQMVGMGRMNSYRLTRAKLGFRSMNLPEFHIMMEFDNMQQLDDAMTSVIRNVENIEEAHVGFNQLVDVETIQHFLYRDYPDDLNNHKLTEQSKQFTIKEIAKATKDIDPDIWK